MLAACWAVKQLDAEQNIVHIENVKARDFQACQPFQLAGRPSIDQLGDFVMHQEPGVCGSLMDEQEPEPKGGATSVMRETRSANIALLRQWLDADPTLTSPAIVKMFAEEGIKVVEGTVRRYRSDLSK
jgi:hypothetical protein